MDSETDQIPDFYDDAEKSLAEAWRLIEEGVGNRRSPFHTPVVATCGLDGSPQSRIVVLRDCDRHARTLRFHSDRRCQKVAQLGRDARASMLFFDPVAKIQLRVLGAASIHHDDAVSSAAWSNTRSFSRICYRVQPGPGTPIEAPSDPEFQDGGEDDDGGRDMFCAVMLSIHAIEWLFLAHQGNRRLMFDWREGSLETTWLVP